MYRLPGRLHFGATRLAPVIGIKPELLYQLLEQPTSTWYRQWEKEEDSGKIRQMMTPCKLLRQIQQAILQRPFRRVKLSSIAHGCIKGRSIRTCILEHTGARSAVCLDLSGAYDSVGLVVARKELGIQRQTDFRLFRGLVEIEHRYRPIFGRVDHRLPQGAPTSPAAFNISCRYLDKRLEAFADRLGGTVTRYVDDIVFSWEKDEVPAKVLNALIRMIEHTTLDGRHPKDRLSVNHEKTQLINRGNRQGVPIRSAGVNLIDDHVGLPKEDLRHLRMDLYCAYMSEHRGRVDGILGHAINVYGEELPWQILGVVMKFDPVRFRKLLLDEQMWFRF